MRQRAKAWLAAAAAKLPEGTRYALLQALVREYGERNLLVDMATQARITGFLVNGQCGLIQSATTDRKILPEYARTGRWAQRTNDTFARFFAGEGGTYLDIGANIGLTTIPVAQDPAVRCIAFEPDPSNFANLSDNVARNVRHGNVALHQLALFDRGGTLDFSLAADGNLGDHRVASAATARGQTITVPCARLDDVLAPPEGLLGVKLDAQGAEPFIIAGGQAVLGRAALIVLEYSPMLIDQLGGDLAILLTFLTGFERLRLARGDDEQEPEPVAAQDLPSVLQQAYDRYRTDDRFYFDVYAARGPLRI
jgi:FkbM family methyltransferase